MECLFRSARVIAVHSIDTHRHNGHRYELA